MFAQLSDRLAVTFKGLRGKGRLSPADVDATVREIRVALLEADVALPVVKTFCERVRVRALSDEVSGALNPAQQVVKIVNDELVTILGGQTRRIRLAKNPPTVIMLLGLQGAGKTTLAGKLALYLREQGHAPLLVAADLQRPNAVDQLQVVGERAGVPVFAPEPGNGVGDPVVVSRRAIDEARTKLYDVVIVDTAGRLAIDEDLVEQAAAIKAAVQPDETLLVVDAMIGQDSVQTAELFLDRVGFDGVVLTKIDGDARGGAALSLVESTGRPVMFASTGEKLSDFELFHPDRMASRILDMGDILTLIEQAEKAFDADEAAKMAEKVKRGDDFTLEDFLSQLQAVKNMGSIGKLMGMLPGMQEARQQLNQIDDKDLTRIEAIIRSMTPAEREDPKILDGSRRARIARGAGVHTAEVNQLVTRFLEAQKMMRKMRMGGGVPGMPGFGGGKKSQSKKAGKGAKKSGNPAKRAQEEALAAQRALEAAANPGQPIPKSAEEMQAAMDGLKLPPGLGGLLGR